MNDQRRTFASTGAPQPNPATSQLSAHTDAFDPYAHLGGSGAVSGNTPLTYGYAQTNYGYNNNAYVTYPQYLPQYPGSGVSYASGYSTNYANARPFNASGNVVSYNGQAMNTMNTMNAMNAMSPQRTNFTNFGAMNTSTNASGVRMTQQVSNNSNFNSNINNNNNNNMNNNTMTESGNNNNDKNNNNNETSNEARNDDKRKTELAASMYGSNYHPYYSNYHSNSQFREKHDEENQVEYYFDTTLKQYVPVPIEVQRQRERERAMQMRNNYYQSYRNRGGYRSRGRGYRGGGNRGYNRRGGRGGLRSNHRGGNRFNPRNGRTSQDNDNENENSGDRKLRTKRKHHKWQRKGGNSMDDNNNNDTNDQSENEESIDENDELTTEFESSPTRLQRFFNIVNSDMSKSDCQKLFENSTLLLPSVGVGNIGQLSIDILLTSLKAKENVELMKIGEIGDRNLISAVGNDALASSDKNDDSKTKETKSGDETKMEKKGGYNSTMEVFFYKEAKLCIIQQRSQIRRGGRVEFVKNLIEWIKDCKFSKIILLTSEPLSSIDNDSQLNSVSNDFSKRFVFYCNNQEMTDEIKNKLNWQLSLKKEFLKENNDKPKSSLLVDNSDDENETKKNENDKNVSDLSKMNVIGGGICNKLYSTVSLPMIVLAQYSNDGDNSQESFFLVANLIEYLTEVDSKAKQFQFQLRQPESFSFAFGGKIPNQLY